MDSPSLWATHQSEVESETSLMDVNDLFPVNYFLNSRALDSPNRNLEVSAGEIGLYDHFNDVRWDQKLVTTSPESAQRSPQLVDTALGTHSLEDNLQHQSVANAALDADDSDGFPHSIVNELQNPSMWSSEDGSFLMGNTIRFDDMEVHYDDPDGATTTSNRYSAYRALLGFELPGLNGIQEFVNEATLTESQPPSHSFQLAESESWESGTTFGLEVAENCPCMNPDSNIRMQWGTCFFHMPPNTLATPYASRTATQGSESVVTTSTPASNSEQQARRTARPTEAEWERVKPQFAKYYLESNLKLKQVMDILKHRHNFDAT